MRELVRCAPPNSQFYLEDSARKGTSPEIEGWSPAIWSTRSCIIVGCFPFMDGETEFILSDQSRDALPEPPAFDGVLDTPSRIIELSTSEWQILTRHVVPTHLTRVRIWTDHPSEPEHILVVLG